jgi:hypothetical protein
MSALLLLSSTVFAGGKKTEIQQEFSIKAQAGGPPIEAPAPRADKETVGEVVRSLDLYKTDSKTPATAVTLPSGSKRLNRPFPEPPFLTLDPKAIATPYDSWVFEVLANGEVIWRSEGAGPVRERIEWDGSGSAGDIVVRVERTYRFRFTGKNGPGQFTVESAPLALKSLAYTEYLGETRLEVANASLYQKGKASFSVEGADYLSIMEDRLRRADVKDQPYRFTIYDPAPKSALPQERARKLKSHFAKVLLINPKLVQVDVLSAGARGETTVCLLPAEKGAVIRNE